MKVLALDQATRKTGYAISENGKIIDYGVLKAKNADDMRVKIDTLAIDTHPDYIFLEGVHYGKNVKVLITLGILWRDVCKPEVIESHEVQKWLNLPMKCPRDRKKERAQFWATSEIMGEFYAMDATNDLIDEDAADAIVLCKMGERRIFERAALEKP